MGSCKTPLETELVRDAAVTCAEGFAFCGTLSPDKHLAELYRSLPSAADRRQTRFPALLPCNFGLLSPAGRRSQPSALRRRRSPAFPAADGTRPGAPAAGNGAKKKPEGGGWAASFSKLLPLRANGFNGRRLRGLPWQRRDGGGRAGGPRLPGTPQDPRAAPPPQRPAALPPARCGSPAGPGWDLGGKKGDLGSLRWWLLGEAQIGDRAGVLRERRQQERGEGRVVLVTWYLWRKTSVAWLP